MRTTSALRDTAPPGYVALPCFASGLLPDDQEASRRVITVTQVPKPAPSGAHRRTPVTEVCEGVRLFADDPWLRP